MSRKCKNPVCYKYDKIVQDNVCEACGQLTKECKTKIVNFEIIVIVVVILVVIVSSLLIKNGKISNSLTTKIFQNEKEKIILKIHGSNAMGEKLAPRLVEDFLKSKNYTNVSTETGDAKDEFKVIGTSPNGKEEKDIVEIKAHGSSTAFEDLLSNECDIGMVSRKIKDVEVKKFNDNNLGDMTLPTSEYVLGLDGVAVIVNQNNNVKQLSVDELNKIFTGKINNWKQIGRNNGEINLYAMDDKSGTFDMFKSMVINNQTMASNTKRFEDSTSLSEGVAGDVNAIGFVALPYIGNTKAIAVSSGQSIASMPNRFTIATEDYPLTRRLYFYVTTKNNNSIAKEFIKYTLTKQGQDTLDNVGFVSQNINVSNDKKVASTAWNKPKTKQNYATNITNSKGRLSLDFRFKSGSTILDNKALKDLDRVVQYLNSPENAKSKIMLFGFTDNVGDYNSNMSLSKERAYAVEQELIYRDNNLNNYK